MAFLEDPRLRQRWNQISHNAEAVTENAAAGIWNFQQRYLGPCLSSICESVDSCTALCLGDREDRARRQRERERGARGTPAEYSFDFYDDWDDDDDALAGTLGGGSGGGRSGLLGSWGGGRAEDWDRLLAGTGSGRSRAGGEGLAAGDVTDHQPRRKRGMSYGTRGPRRTPTTVEDDPTIIPSTAPLGFLGRLPFKIGGTLRYKPSAANLRDHPGGGMGHAAEDDEHEPLLPGSDSDDDYDDGGRWQRRRQPPGAPAQTRKRSGTAGSGDTSSSYRSRGDLFPSDGEGDEDAVPLDDEFAVALDRVDDRSSGKTRSSKGKRRADSNKAMSRSVSRTTIASQQSAPAAGGGSLRKPPSSLSLEAVPDAETVPSLKDLRREEELAEREEDEEIERKRAEAAKLALERGLRRDGSSPATSVQEIKAEMVQIEGVDEIPEPSVPELGAVGQGDDGLREGERTRSRDDEIPQDDTADQDPAADVEEPEVGPSPALPPPASRSEPEQPRELEPEFVPARLPHFR